MKRASGSLFYRAKPRTEVIRKKRWHWPSILWRAVKRTCMVLGAIMLLWILLGTLSFIALMTGGGTSKTMPHEMVLVMKLEEGIGERPVAPSLSDPFPSLQPTIRQVVDQLDAAGKDKRVKGFVLSLKGAGVSLVHVQELRAALARFKESGKFTKIYAPSYADAGRGLGIYYLASAFDEIWMQPVGMLSMTGVSMDMPYGRGALDKLGVTPEFFQRERYKGAMENFTDTKMSAASRETLQSIVDDLSARMMEEIAADRAMSVADLKKQVDIGLLGGEEALQAGLIDRLDYGDVMIDELDAQIGGDVDYEGDLYVAFEQYRTPRKSPSLMHKTATVALIHASGMITPGEGGQKQAGADTIANALYDAAEDDEIKAVVLRIDSPGGSPSASETIRRAAMKVKEEDKQLIVSMGPVAASGGYWIAANADHIFALPGTLTGSIGVVMGKFSLGKLWDKVGVNWDGVSYGENSDLWSLNETFDARAQKRVNALLDQTYDAFLTRVAEGRGKTKEEARKVAQGRAWTGAQAQARGLVDELGGLDEALDYTAQALGHESRDDLTVVTLPREKKPLEQLLLFLEQQASIGQFFGAVQAKLSLWKSGASYAVYDPALDLSLR